MKQAQCQLSRKVKTHITKRLGYVHMPEGLSNRKRFIILIIPCDRKVGIKYAKPRILRGAGMTASFPKGRDKLFLRGMAKWHKNVRPQTVNQYAKLILSWSTA